MPQRGIKDGKGLEGSRIWDQELRGLGEAVLRMNRLPVVLLKQDIYLKQLKFVCKDEEGGDWLVVLTADGDNGPIICFHGSTSISEALRGISQMAERAQLRWKEDTYGKAK